MPVGRGIFDPPTGRGIIYDSLDPAASGVAAPVGMLYVREGTPGVYFKSGAANTAWTQLAASAGFLSLGGGSLNPGANLAVPGLLTAGAGAFGTDPGGAETLRAASLRVAGVSTLAGGVALTGGSNVNWTTAGVAPPSFTTRSIGTKLVLFPAIAAASGDYAVGMEGSHLWLSVPTFNGALGFKFYGGTTEVARLGGDGSLTLAGSLAAAAATVNGTQPAVAWKPGAGTSRWQLYMASAADTNLYLLDQTNGVQQAVFTPGAGATGLTTLAGQLGWGGGASIANSNVVARLGQSNDFGLFNLTASLFVAAGAAGGFQFADRNLSGNVFVWYASANVARLYWSGDATDKLTLDTSGNLSIAGNYTTNGVYRLFGQTALSQSGSYNRLHDPQGAARVHVGGTGDPTNYYDNTTHRFRSIAGVVWATLDAATLTSNVPLVVASGGPAGGWGDGTLKGSNAWAGGGTYYALAGSVSTLGTDGLIMLARPHLPNYASHGALVRMAGAPGDATNYWDMGVLAAANDEFRVGRNGVTLARVTSAGNMAIFGQSTPAYLQVWRGGSLMGYLYSNADGFGLLNDTGAWSVRCAYGGSLGGQLYGSWVIDNMLTTVGGYQYAYAKVIVSNGAWNPQAGETPPAGTIILEY